MSQMAPSPDLILDHFNVDSNSITALKERFAGSSSIRTKYFQALPTHLQKNIDRVLSMELQKSAPKRIFDIGSGCCFFPAVAEYFGHTVVSTDVDLDAPIFKDIRELFGQEIEELYVRPFEKLPDHYTAFDRITSFATCFHMYGLGTDHIEHWPIPEWSFLLSDLCDRLTADGSIVFDINKDPTAHNGMNTELKNWFQSLEGAALRDLNGYFRLTLNARQPTFTDVT